MSLFTHKLEIAACTRKEVRCDTDEDHRFVLIFSTFKVRLLQGVNIQDRIFIVLNLHWKN